MFYWCLAFLIIFYNTKVLPIILPLIFFTLKQILCQALHAVILYRRGRATFCVVWVQLTIFLLYEIVKRLRIILF